MKTSFLTSTSRLSLFLLWFPSASLSPAMFSRSRLLRSSTLTMGTMSHYQAQTGTPSPTFRLSASSTLLLCLSSILCLRSSSSLCLLFCSSSLIGQSVIWRPLIGWGCLPGISPAPLPLKIHSPPFLLTNHTSSSSHLNWNGSEIEMFLNLLSRKRAEL